MNQELRNRLAETIIVITALVAAWYILAQPMHDRAAKIRAEAARLQAEATQYESSTTLPPDQAQAFQQRVDALLELATPQPTLEQHERILSLAQKHNLDVARINPARHANARHLGPILADERRIEIEARGSFADVAAFLSKLATDEPMTLVEHFSIDASDSSTPDAVELTASIKFATLSADRAGLAEVRP